MYQNYQEWTLIAVELFINDGCLERELIQIFSNGSTIYGN